MLFFSGTPWDWDPFGTPFGTPPWEFCLGPLVGPLRPPLLFDCLPVLGLGPWAGPAAEAVQASVYNSTARSQ